MPTDPIRTDQFQKNSTWSKYLNPHLFANVLSLVESPTMLSNPFI